MTVIVCLDDNGGMMFNKRRQSRDRTVTADIVNTVGGGRLFFDGYSAMLFEGASVRMQTLADGAVPATGDGCFLFAENRPLLPLAGVIDRIIIYRWNRVYPADMYFDIPLEREGFRLEAVSEFEGYSHEKITKEIYTK